MLGSALADEATARGHAVTLLSRQELDVTHARQAAYSLREHQPELVFHTAALTKVNYCEEHPEEAQHVNVQGTAHVTAAAAELGARLVYFSTDYVFDGSGSEPILEDAAPAPLNAYGESKLAGERHVADYEYGHIVRTSGVFGRRHDGAERNFFRAVFDRLAQTDGAIEVVDDQRTCVSFAPHLAAMLLGLVEAGLPRLLHLTSAGENSWHGWARELAQAAGFDPARFLPVPTDASSPVRRPHCSVLGSRHPVVQALISQHPATQGIAEYVRLLKQG
jgi:dTDP-4-dehydrorhamnose reductase